MPRSKSAQPAYQYHVSGQAVVRLDYKDFYLGKHGTPESYARYYALLAEYNANGRKAPGERVDQPTHQEDTKILVKHVTADFLVQVLPTIPSKAHSSRFKLLCGLLDEKHGNEPVDDFGPRKLEELRARIVKQGIGKCGRPNSRRQANELTRCLVRIIEHGVARELVAPERIVALKALAPLKRGQAPDRPKRKAVPVDDIRKTVSMLTKTVAAMIEIQLATAMRPSELFRMTPAMIDRTGPVWLFKPDTHKTSHHDIEKAVPILGRALEALSPYMFGDPDDLCFRTQKGTPWNKDSYRRAVERAALAAGVAHWSPYAIRRTALQHVRDTLGPEFAQALAGHSRISTTEIYTRAAEAKAIEAAQVASRIG